MANITGELGPLAGWLRAHMARLTGIPLSDRVEATAQRMGSGDGATVHSDRPLVGFEVARLVVQLNRDPTVADGGLFLVHGDAEAQTVHLERLPDWNSAVGFVMRPGSWHSVTPVVRERRTVVFNFWHPANDQPVVEWVAQAFAGMSFADLPTALDAHTAEAEARWPEDDTLRASTVAWVLHRWGYPPALLVDAYGASLAGELQTPDPEWIAAFRLATWVVRLRLEDFDVDGWALLKRAVPNVRWPRLVEVARVCLPSITELP
jgi:hypothetical protein